MRFPELLQELKQMQDQLNSVKHDLAVIFAWHQTVKAQLKELPMAQDLGLVSRETEKIDGETLF